MDVNLVADLLEAADKYNIVALKEKCEEFLCDKMNGEIAVVAFLLGHLHKTAMLKTVAARFTWMTWSQLINGRKA